MIIETVPVGSLETNAYIVAADDSAEAAVIDPGEDGGRILATAEAAGLTIKKIILTHGHWDHIGAVAEVVEATGAEVYIHEDDLEYLADPDKNLSGLVFERRESRADHTVIAGDTVTVGPLELSVIHTPGHTPGGISLLVEGNLFCGDLVFYNSVGRTDLPGGNNEQMHKSVHGQVMVLPDETHIFPGHGPATTVGRERAENPFLISGW